ncbi:Uncharacterized protein TCM_045627 [Theobroma cacao]|uniref:Uncharacterized protein n=1 Tax=Theobroma cacao TaxID=3641 RepID=S1S3M9_THECC|nr:Uncharacterized protein TCM_045627 [Theobroma cacao]
MRTILSLGDLMIIMARHFPSPPWLPPFTNVASSLHHRGFLSSFPLKIDHQKTYCLTLFTTIFCSKISRFSAQFPATKLLNFGSTKLSNLLAQLLPNSPNFFAQIGSKQLQFSVAKVVLQ